MNQKRKKIRSNIEISKKDLNRGPAKKKNIVRGYPKSFADLNVINAHAKCSIAR